MQIEHLMAAADRAFYRAKADGRNRVMMIDCDAAREAVEAAPSLIPDTQVFALSIPSRSAA